MKIQSMVVGVLLMGSGPMVYAGSTPASQLDKDGLPMMHGVLPKATAMYAYTDFDFDSTAGANFNRYQGHTNLYSIGADNLKVMDTLWGGLSLFRAETDLNWQSAFDPIPVEAFTSQSISNNSIYGHLLKQFTPSFYVDIAAAYGQSKVNIAISAPNNAPPHAGFANYTNHNWLANLNGIYTRCINKFDVIASAGILYSQISTDGYDANFTLPGVFSVPVDPFTNKVTMLTENVELGYRLNEVARPFISGGLFQVIDFSNSRALFSTPVASPLPQLTLDENGFRLGAGVAMNYQNFDLRVSENYYNAGGVFTSYQTVAALSYKFS